MGDLNIDKFHKAGQIASEMQSQPVAKSESKINIPIGQKSESADAYTQLIQSPDFLALNNAEKLEKLKELMPDASEDVLKTIVSGLKSTVQSEKSTKSDVNVPDENVPADNSEATQLTPQELSGEEKLTLEYARQLEQKEGNVTLDDVIAAIKSKNPEELSVSEKQILYFIEKSKDGKIDKNDVKTFLSESGEALDNLIPKEVIQSEVWQRKTPMEKLNSRVDAFLSTIIKGYDKIDNEAVKDKMRQELYDKIGNMMDPEGYSSKTKEEKIMHLQVMSVIADATEKSGLTIKDVLAISQEKGGKEKLEGMFIKYSAQIVDNAFDKSSIDVTQPTWKEKSVNERLMDIAKQIVISVDPNISGEELENTAKTWIDAIGKQLYSNWDNPEERKVYTSVVCSRLESFILYNSDHSDDKISIVDAIMNNAKKATMMNYYEKVNGIQLSETQKIHRTIMQSLKPGEQMTDATILRYFEQKGVGNLSQAEKDMYEHIKGLYDNMSGNYSPEEIEKLKNQPLADPSETIAYTIMNQYNGDYSKWLDEYCKQHDLDIKNLSKDQKRAILEAVGDFTIASDIAMQCLGFKNQAEVIDELGFIKTARQIALIDDDRRRSEAWGFATGSRDPKARATARGALADEAKKDPDAAAAGMEISLGSNNPYAVENASEMPQAYKEKNVPLSNVSRVAAYIGNSENVSTETKNIYDNGILNVTCSNDQERAKYNEYICDNCTDSEFLEVHSANVSNSVKDPECRKQCRDAINRASSQFDSETKQKINNAYETGKVSDETAAKLSSEKSSSKTKETETSGSKESSSAKKSSAKTESTSDKKTSEAKTSSTTSSSATKASSTTSSKASSTSTTQNTPAATSASTSTITTASQATAKAAAIAQIQLNQQILQQITSELEAKKEISLQRLTEIIDNYQKSVREREERKAQLETQAAEAAEKEIQAKAEEAKVEDAVITAAKSPQTTEEEAKKAIEQAVQSSGGLAQNFITTIKSNLTEDQVKTLSAASSDAAIYQALGSIDTGYQAKFLSDFAAHASTSALCTFAAEHIGDKALLRTLFEKSQDPALLQYLGESAAFDLLEKGKIQIKDFLRFASADTVAKYIRQMQQEGNTGAIKQITNLMSLEQGEQLAELTEDKNDYIADTQDKSDKKNEPIPGSDEWLKAQQSKMAYASSAAPSAGPFTNFDESEVSGFPPPTVSNWKLGKRKKYNGPFNFLG